MSGIEVAAGLAVLAGALLQSAVGFGFSLVCAPLVFAAAATPEHAVWLLIALGLEVNLLTVATEGRRVSPLGREVVALLAWSVPGMVLGVVVLRAADATLLQVLVTVAVVSGLAVQRWAGRGAGAAGAVGRKTGIEGEPGSLGPTRAAGAVGRKTGIEGVGSDRSASFIRNPDESCCAPAARWASAAAGFSSGALSTSVSASGPPLVLYLVGRGIPPLRIRDTLTVCFLGISVISPVVLALGGAGAGGRLPSAAAFAALGALVAVGHLLGRPVFARISARHYEPVLTSVLVASAVSGLLVALI